MLTVENISKSFGNIKAVDSISFTLRPGEVVGILGPNGAGKTTTLRIVAGLIAPDEGRVIFYNQMQTLPSRQFKKSLGYLLENNPLYLEMMVIEFLDFIAGCRGMTKQERKRKIRQAVASTGLSSVLFQSLRELSKGYRQRVGLAQPILSEPDLLILDEPTEGLDPNQRREIHTLIKSIGKNRTVILSTHVLPEVQEVCDRVIVIHQGKKVADGKVDDLAASFQDQKIITIGTTAQVAKEQWLQITGVEEVTAEEKVKNGFLYKLKANNTGTDLRLILFNWAKQNNVDLFELHQQELNLDDLFRKLTTAEK